MKIRKKFSPKCASTVQVKNFLTEFTLESSAFKYNERLTYYQIARGLVLGGLISLKYSPFDEFISKKFSKKVDGAFFFKTSHQHILLRVIQLTSKISSCTAVETAK